MNNKVRLTVSLNKDTYDGLSEFIKNNELITTQLNKGTTVTLALNLLYKAIEHTDINKIMEEYLQDTGSGENNDGL